MAEDDDFKFEDLKPTLGFDITKVPDTFKPVAMEVVIGMNTWLMETLEEEGILFEMLTWSTERIKQYEQALISKREAERGD
jgi:hypothetical protein